MHWGDFGRRLLATPVIWTGVVVDLAPVAGVLFLGWDAAALIQLFWLETLTLGALTLPRIVLPASQHGFSGMIGGGLAAGFFLLHYLLFCAAHGSLLMAFLGASHRLPDGFAPPPFNIVELVATATSSVSQIFWFLALIVWQQWFALVREFMRGGRWKGASFVDAVFEPYGRILVLHVGLFAALAAMTFAGEPLWGLLGMILARLVWNFRRNLTEFVLANAGAAPSPQPPEDAAQPVF